MRRNMDVLRYHAFLGKFRRRRIPGYKLIPEITTCVFCLTLVSPTAADLLGGEYTSNKPAEGVPPDRRFWQQPRKSGSECSPWERRACLGPAQFRSRNERRIGERSEPQDHQQRHCDDSGHEKSAHQYNYQYGGRIPRSFATLRLDRGDSRLLAQRRRDVEEFRQLPGTASGKRHLRDRRSTGDGEPGIDRSITRKSID
jgi:hypothetical protein